MKRKPAPRERTTAAAKPRAKSHAKAPPRSLTKPRGTARAGSRAKPVTTVRVANKTVPATTGHPIKPIRGASVKQLARVRRICLALPEATEKIAWGSPTFRAPKIFAMFADDHHRDGRIALWCPAPKGAQVVLTSSEPQRFFVPPYVGKGGWIGVILTAIDDERLTDLVREAYCLVASPKLRAQLGE